MGMNTKNFSLLRVGLGCLIGLCCKNEYSCIQLGEFGVVSWLGEMISTTDNEEIIRNGLLLLCQGQFEESRAWLLKENLLPVVICWAKFGSEILSPIANQIYGVLSNPVPT